MKNITIISLFVAVCLMLSSCQKPFDLSTDGRLTYDEIFSDYKLAGGFLNTAYGYMPGYGSGSAAGTFLAVFTDEAQDAQDVTTGNQSLNYYNNRMTSRNNIINGSLYNNMLQGIRICNIFIDRIDDVPYMTVEKHRSQWKGEAYVLRAYYYLQLIKRYGPIPIIKQELPINYDYSQHKRPTFYQNVKAIIEDCNLALDEAELPWRVSITTQNGCMTKALAWAIKSQAILYAASPLWNDGENHWQEAATITGDALTALLANGYELYNPKSSTLKAYGNYQRLFLTAPEQTETPSERETIYAQKGQIGAIWQQHGLPMMPDVIKAGACPSQELVDSYETLDGVPVLDLKRPYLDKEHLLPNYNPENTMYNRSDPYANRDPRLFSTVYCNGNSHNLNDNTLPVQTFVGGNCGISQTSPLYTRTGYYLRKFVHYDSKKSANKDGYWRHFRLAELYLNFAEAEYYANGVTTEARDAVDAIRLRAGIEKLPATISSEEFEVRLRNERRVEFAFEEHRYYDVRRWKIQSDVEGVVSGMKITFDPSSATNGYERVVVQKRLVTDSKYLMWPIPFAEQSKFEMIGVSYQNPGW